MFWSSTATTPAISSCSCQTSTPPCAVTSSNGGNRTDPEVGRHALGRDHAGADQCGLLHAGRMEDPIAVALAAPVSSLPIGPYFYEAKYDGHRLLMRCEADRVRCQSRAGRDSTR